VATAVAFLLPLIANAVELSEEARALGKERRDAAIAQAKQQVTDLEKQRAEAAKGRDLARVSVLLRQIKQAKLELTKVTKKTVEDYASELTEVGGNAAGGPAMPAQQPQPDPAAAQAAAAEEAERKQLSGDCPLKLNMVNFIHADAQAVRLGASSNLFPSDLFGPKTIVICEVVNKSGQTVEAYEVFCEFLDGFDKVIAEKTFQGTLLRDGEAKKTINGIAPIELAVQMKLFVQRAKLADATIWERQPEHKRVGMIVKKLEGADLGAGKK
jgi:hypothetical protein